MHTPEEANGRRGLKRYALPAAVLLASILAVPAPGRGGGLAADGAGRIRLDSMVIDKAAKEIRIQAEVAIREGILEYLLVGSEGKTYESVFQVKGNRPSELAFALLLIGVEPLDFARYTEMLAQEKGAQQLAEAHGRSLVTIELFADGRRLDVAQFVRCREPSPPRLRWVFTGGGFLPDNRYAGDLESNFIAIWPDPTAAVNLFSTLKNPYRGLYGFEIKADSPALELQNVEIRIRRAP